MDRLLSRSYDLNRLSDAARDALAAECRPAFETIFATAGDRDFVRLLFHAEAADNRIRVFRNAQGEVVGFLALTLFEVDIDGRRYGIIRSPMGFLPDYQGRGVLSSPYWFHFIESARCYLSHLTTPLYYVNLMIGPQAYHLNADLTYRTYPSPRFPTIPPLEQRILERCADFFHWGEGDAGYPFTRKLPMSTRLAPEALDTRKPTIQFFVTHNPRYTEGYGITHAIPVTLENFVFSGWLFARKTLRRSVARLSRQPSRAPRG